MKSGLPSYCGAPAPVGPLDQGEVFESIWLEIGRVVGVSKPSRLSPS